ncbi:MAG TPA: hypothetical protein VHM91_13105, partial [Verrucomicrobiales bacterium]|nr:hypothetical protein [Verrucomicrobiales bacterium]
MNLPGFLPGRSGGSLRVLAVVWACLAGAAGWSALSGRAHAANTAINVDFNSTDGSYGTFTGTGAAADTGTVWNGVAPGAESGGLYPAFTTGNLVTSAGAPTAITVSLGNFKVYEANENPAGFSSSLMTDFLYQQTLGPGGPNSTISINHLDPAVAYDLFFYSQNGGYGNTATVFTINGLSKTA